MRLVDQDIPGPKRDYIGYGRRPPKVFWPNDAKAAVSICINYEEGSEYSKAAGDDRNEGLAEIPYVMNAQYRDLCAESIYEYGSRAGVWRLLHLFDEHETKTTFYPLGGQQSLFPSAPCRVRRRPGSVHHKLCRYTSFRVVLRPLTDAETVTELRFEPPGRGFWEQDPVHFPLRDER